MIVGLTGLHGAGKSYVGQLLKETFRWTHFEKRAYLKTLYKIKNSQESIALSWLDWHHQLYSSKGSFYVMLEILKMNFPNQSVLVVDAVHNIEEWRAIKQVEPRAILAGVFSPSSTREERREPEESILDKKRIAHWHGNADVSNHCLISEAEWAFTGLMPRDFLVEQCKVLRHYLYESKRII